MKERLDDEDVEIGRCCEEKKIYRLKPRAIPTNYILTNGIKVG